MKVKKLYYEDSHMKTFEAGVTGCQKGEKGYLVTLDATAFYPEGGGQPSDRGTLGGVRVLDVQEQGEDVVHLCDGPLEPGTRVAGRIDWDRRFDLMQQHSGEHMVSGTVHKKYGCHNVGFHMGAEFITVDFDFPIPPEDLPEIEQTVNRAIWQDIPLRCWVPSPEELPGVQYRTKKALPWPVRIVEIPGVDSCACCGVQVKTTGEIGLVKLFSCVRFHQGVRIEMACGARAFRLLSRIWEQNRQVSQVLSVPVWETGEGAGRLQDQLAQEKFRTVGLQKQILAGIAEKYRDAEDPVCFVKDLSPAQVRELADAIGARCRGAATVLSGSDEGGYSLCILSRQGDVRPLGKAAAEALHGRGGGKPNAYQGSLQATYGEIAQFFRLDGGPEM